MAQEDQPPPSSWHSNVEPPSSALNEKDAPVELVGSLGWAVIVVFGAVVSTEKARVAGAATLPAVSVARRRTVYAPSAAKFAPGKESDHEAVPVAVRQFSVPSAKAVPFQYWLSESRLIESSTFCSAAPPASEAVPAKSLQPARL